MAVNKRKVLEAARKHAQKGAKQKALKEYNKLVQADPRDAKLLLEVGDVYRRWGQAEEAIAQYTKVANQYKQDGFDARAVAVLKQILNLDPKRYTAHVTLADLYQRMGLDSDAVGALQTAADGYYREGRRKEALELLRKMAALDPTNTTSRLKVADLLRQEGMEDDAVGEYEEVIGELNRQGAGEQVCSVQERILEIRPDHVPTLSGLARGLSDLGKPDRAEPFAARALEASKEPEQYELLAGIYKSLGEDAKLAEVTKELAALYRSRGDEDHAREVLQRLPPEPMSDDVPDFGQDESELEELGEEELLEDEDFLLTDDAEHADDTLMQGGVPGADAAPAADEPVEEQLPEGDPEQLLAEASVYLRYGKRAQAIASLKSALRQEPEHRGVLETLGDAYAEEGAQDDAIGCWQQAAELARSAGDADAFGVLRDRIGALDPEAAAEIEPMGDAPAADAGAAALELDADDEFEIDVDASEDEPPAADEGLDLDVDVDLSGGGEDEEQAAPESDPNDMGGLELDLDDDIAGVEASASDEAPALDDSAIEFEVDVDSDGEGAPADEGMEIGLDDEEAKPARAPSAQLEESSSTAAQIQEDLEEAEFYLQQGLDDEAEEIYRRILAMAPNHPSAMLKLGELAARRGDDPASAADAPDAKADDGPALDDDSGIEIDFDEPEEEAAAPEAPADAKGPELSEDLAAILAEADAAVDAEEEADAADSGIEFDVATDDEPDRATDEDDTAPEVAAAADETEEEGLQSIGDLLGEDATEVETVGPDPDAAISFGAEPVQAEPDAPRGMADVTLPLGAAEGAAPAEASAAMGTSSDATFDLAAELADVFEDDGPDPNETTGSGSTAEDGFESLFADFKKGVSATLEEGDYDTRFDLGIAYREMGLFDDAIAEFRVCLDSPTRQVESLHMMALCAMELGRASDAVNHLEQALAGGDLPADRTVGLQFDLGRAQRAAGDPAAAKRAFESVQQIDASFPGLTEELAALESGAEAPAPAGGDDGFESFDDIMSDDDDAGDAPEAPAEAFESFDDVITEAEAELTPEAEVEPEADPGATATGRPKGKKKKISFV